MTGQFVALPDDTPDHLRVALGDPSQGKERRLDTVAVEQFENAVHIAFHTTFPIIPGITPDITLECRDLEVVFHVDSHHIGQLRHGKRQSGRLGP